ncbi:hypothetical protein M408DRAFT_327756 [Serendipita vermifera MAFF 305830]|uniref:Uncharacterized protein n=1 Tax=Serendipita vermifera MAFF 305830 TaxID=933852 RepID=A0A0C2XP76_SERVB|nr:hypothetical protein M408DRAFT_327756 [Serendipita vermifera MAFF 305830]
MIDDTLENTQNDYHHLELRIRIVHDTRVKSLVRHSLDPTSNTKARPSFPTTVSTTPLHSRLLPSTDALCMFTCDVGASSHLALWPPGC